MFYHCIYKVHVIFHIILDWAHGSKLQRNVFCDFDNDKIKTKWKIYQKNMLHKNGIFDQNVDTFSSSWHSKQMFEVITL